MARKKAQIATKGASGEGLYHILDCISRVMACSVCSGNRQKAMKDKTNNDHEASQLDTRSTLSKALQRESSSYKLHAVMSMSGAAQWCGRFYFSGLGFLKEMVISVELR